MKNTEIVETVVRTMAQIEDERKEAKRKRNKETQKEPRIQILEEEVSLKGSGQQLQEWSTIENNYVTRIVWAKYKPPWEKRTEGVLLELNPDYAWPRDNGAKLVIAPNVRFEQDYHGRMTFRFLQEHGTVRHLIYKKTRYIAFEKGEGSLTLLAAAGYIATLRSDYDRLYAMILNHLSEYLTFTPGHINLAGYETVVDKCNAILDADQDGLMNRHMLLAGPPGCGKSQIAKKLASEQDDYLCYAITRSQGWMDWVELLGKILEFCDKKILILIDEIDELGLHREAARQYVFGLLRFLDGVEDHSNVKVIATTNRPQDLDPALLRVGRFGPVIYVDKPTKEQKMEIFKYYLDKYTSDVNIEHIVDNINGELTGADIRAGVEDCIIYNQDMNTENIMSNLRSLIETRQKLDSFYTR